MIAIAEQDAIEHTDSEEILLSGGAGDDKIEGMHKIITSTIIGGDGMDKLIGGNNNDTQKIYGGD